MGRSHADLIEQFFDTSRFTVNRIGTFGTSGKNNMRGPRYFKTDLGILKNFRITEQHRIQFRTEFFNVFNNVNFDAPGNNVSSTDSFGRITSAQSPRILQFALKYLF